MLPVSISRLLLPDWSTQNVNLSTYANEFFLLHFSGNQIFGTICHLTENIRTRQFHEKVATVWRLGSNTAGLLINEPKPTFACLMNEHGKRVSEFPSQSETLKL